MNTLRVYSPLEGPSLMRFVSQWARHRTNTTLRLTPLLSPTYSRLSRARTKADAVVC